MCLPNRHGLPAVERRERRLPGRACLGVLSCAGPTGCHGLGHLPMLAEPSSVREDSEALEACCNEQAGPGGGVTVGVGSAGKPPWKEQGSLKDRSSWPAQR